MVRIPLALSLLLALAACAGEPMDLSRHGHQRFETRVEAGKAIGQFARPAAGQALAAADKARLAALVAEHQRRGAGRMEVDVSAAGREDPAARAFADLLADGLMEAGMDRDDLKVRLVIGEEGATGAAVTAPVWVARVPDCGKWEDEIGEDRHNGTTSNFGCAVNRNIGLMVSNPADLVRARAATGRDANRSVVVLDKFGKGEATGSASPFGGGVTSGAGSTTK